MEEKLHIIILIVDDFQLWLGWFLGWIFQSSLIYSKA